MEGRDAQVDQIYYIVDLNTRKRGLAKITKAKNQKAIAKFVGEAHPGWDLVLKSESSSQKKEYESYNQEVKEKQESFSKQRSSSSPSSYTKFKDDLRHYVGAYIMGFKDKVKSSSDELEGYNFGASLFF